MSNKLQKAMAVITAFAVTAAVFAGCSKQQNEKAAVKTAEETKPVLKYLASYVKMDPNTYPIAKMLEEKTGYHVEYEMLPQDKPNDKLNLIMAAGQEYDIVTIKGTEIGLYSDYAKRGALVELTPLVDKYGGNIKSMMPDKNFAPLKVENKLYGIPKLVTNAVFGTLAVRQDWLDKLNLKSPKTLDELTAVLKAFKDKDPGGNGAKNIPLVMYEPDIIGITGAFGIANAWNEKDGKLAPRELDPEFKNYLTYVQELYKDGLVDREFATNKLNTMQEKFTAGRAGMMPMDWATVPTVYDALKKNVPDAKVSVVEPIAGKTGEQGYTRRVGLGSITFIPKSSKNQEHAVKWINAKLDEQVFKNHALGEEGKHYTVKDGSYYPIAPIFFDERNEAQFYMTGEDDKNYPKYYEARLRKDERMFEVFNTMQKVSEKSMKTDIILMAPALPNYSKSNQQLITMTKDFIIKVVMGAEPISSLDSFVQKWKAAGGEESSKEIDAWYKTYKK